MRRTPVFLAAFVAGPFLAFGLGLPSVPAPSAPVADGTTAVPLAADDSLAQARQRYIDQVLATIEGREEEPAGEVFANVEAYATMPAGRLLRVMDLGFSRSLGVGCDHCHDPDDWAADALRAKRTAREMIVLVQTLNGELLPRAVELAPDRAANDRPVVNCTTCHRGAVRPALRLAAPE